MDALAIGTTAATTIASPGPAPAPAPAEGPAHPPGDPVLTFLERVHARHRSTLDGEVASYIPALATADPAWYGIALMTVDGTTYEVGDSREPFTIQSISKPFTYGFVLDEHGEAAVRRRIGVEPTGDAFNSISLTPGGGTPFNAMVNAGAITAASLVGSLDGRSPIDRILERYSAAAGRRLWIDAEVEASEYETGHRNRAIAHLLRASGALAGDPDEALATYFAQCSIAVDAVALAAMAATLANGGVNPVSGDLVMAPATVRAVLSVMATCGMYDSAGDWLYTVGLPAKSGVSGGVLAVVPGQLGIAVFSPPLDARGNSVRGVATCRDLAADLDLHMVGRGPAIAPPVRTRHTVARVASKRRRSDAERAILEHAGWQAEVRELQGDLTFLAVETAIRGLRDPGTGPRWAILDLRRVFRVEPGAIGLLADLAQAMRIDDRDLVIAGGAAHGSMLDALDGALDARAERPIQRSSDADHAREWCEDRILDGHGQLGPADEDDTAAATFLGELPPEEAAVIRSRLERRRYPPGTSIVRRDEIANELFLITSGRLSVTVDLPRGGVRRLTTLSAGTVFGELAFVAKETRTADVHADTMVECLVLTSASFDALMTDEPRAAAALLANLLRVVGATARRLTDELALFSD